MIAELIMTRSETRSTLW